MRVGPAFAAAALVAVALIFGPSTGAAAHTITPGGNPVTVTITAANADEVLTFAGVAGQRVSVEIGDVTIGPSACCSTLVSIRKPDGATLAWPTYVGTGGGFLDTRTLPISGTYSIVVDPQGSATGELTLRLHDVPGDATAAAAPDGSATVTTATPGQNARVTFAGTAGSRVSVKVAPSCCTTRMSILSPSGSTLTWPAHIDSRGGFIDTVTLPVTGTYTILVDPQGPTTGSVSLTLLAVPPDVTASIVPGGAPVSVTTSTPGQNALLTFAGTAGQRVSLVLETACCASRVSILRPGGLTLAGPAFLGFTGGFVDAVTLPVTGTYTVLVDPQSDAVGTMTAKLYDVPLDATGTIAAGGGEVTVTTTTPGQDARVTFEGAAGQSVAVEVGPTCCTTRVSILRPDGTTQVAPKFVGMLGGYVDGETLPMTGTYTILLDVYGPSTGSMTVALHGVPGDLSATIAPDAVPVTITTQPGQMVRFTFAGTAGERVALEVTTTCCATQVSMLNPNGTTLVPPTTLGRGGGFLDPRTLPASGIYTIVVDPYNADAGTLTFTLYDVPPDVAASADVDGTAVAVTTTTPGQNARVTFAGAAGDGVSIRVGPFNCCAIRLSVTRPDGATLVLPTGFNPDGGTLNLRLPVAGAYTILVDPQGAASGKVTLRLTVDNTPPALPVLSVTEAAADGHIVGTTLYYRPSGAGGSFTVTATTSDGGSGLAKMRFPGLAGGFAPTTLADDFLTPYSRTYTWTGGATYVGLSNVVTAYDKLGNTASATFSVLPDSDAPTTTDNTGALGSSWKNTTQTVVLTPTDPLSGVAATYATADGSTPTTASPQGTTVTLAAEGIHIVKYFSVDNVGNAEAVRTAGTPIRIDKTKPGSAVLAPLPSVIRSGQILTGSGSDALSGVASITYLYCAGSSCTPSTPAGSSSTPPGYAFTWTSQPADGVYQVLARVSDAAGNTLDSAKRTVTIDNSAPNTSITVGPASPTNATDATFSFTATETGSSFECSVDGGVWSGCTSPRSVAGLAEGAHTFEVRATDPVGNTDPTPAARTWTVDVTPPDTTITGAPADPSPAGVAFTFMSSEPGSTFECRLDAGAWTACTTPASFAGLGSSSHTFEVRATDSAGNVDPAAAARTWTVDATEPETAITSAPSDPAASPVASFAFASSEATSTFECRLDGAAWTGCTSPVTYAGLADGTHTFDVRATDSVGNTDSTPASYGWRVDTAAPETTITSGPAGSTNATGASFGFASSEPGSTFACSLDGAPFTACTSPGSYSSLRAGTHTFAVRATDPAGNTDPTSASRSWIIDLTPPQTAITSAPSDPSGATTGDFAFSADEAGSTFECSLDGAPFAACSSPETYTSLGEGTHTFEVRATDPAGNTDATPTSLTWTVDSNPPDTTIDSGPESPTGSTSATFAFSSTQAGSTFECSLDGAPFASCASPQVYTGLAAGPHTFDVRARDAAGNPDPTPASQAWTVDVTPPETTIVAAPGDPTSATEAVFELSASETGSTFECSHDGAPFAACPAPKAYSGLAEGIHTFAVRATDAAGNLDASPASHSWRVDTTAPPPPVVESPADGASTANDTVTVSGTAEPGTTVEVFDGAASRGTTPADGAGAWSTTLTGVADGSHTYTARATDAAGNTSAVSNGRRITVDTDAPETIMGTSPIGSTSSTSAALSFSSDEAGSTFECSLDGAPFAACSSPHSYHGLAEGAHAFEVRATDVAGNIDPTPAARAWTVDTTAPAAPELTSPADGGVTASASATVAGTAEPGAVVEVFDGGVSRGVTTAGSGGAWSKAVTGLADGSHTFTAKATDAAGNESPLSSGRTVTVDTTAPETTIASGPADPTSETTADPAFSANEPATFECSLDGAPFAPCTSPQSYTALSPGAHVFEVRAIDTAGNVEPTPAAHGWTVA
jgi:hypothetical protein